MQLEHDTAHRITLGVLRLVADRFNDEEMAALYRKTMPVVVAAIHDFKERWDRRLSRLSPCRRSHSPVARIAAIDRSPGG